MSLRVVVFVAVARGQERTLLGSRPLTVLMRTTKALSFFKIWGAVRRGWAACTLFPGLLVSRLWHPRLTGQLLVPQREDPIVGGGGRASASLPGPLCRCGRQGTQPRSILQLPHLLRGIIRSAMMSMEGVTV